MGRGNVCTYNECEGLYYLDRDFLDIYRKVTRGTRGRITGFDFDEEPKTARELREIGLEYDYDGSHADWRYDENESGDSWQNMIYEMQTSLTRRFKSFAKVDKWRGGEAHVVLENSFFQIAVIDNEWSAAWCLLEQTDIDDEGGNRTLMRRHYENYLEGIKTVLINAWDEAIGYGGAWVSGKRYTKENCA